MDSTEDEELLRKLADFNWVMRRFSEIGRDSKSSTRSKIASAIAALVVHLTTIPSLDEDARGIVSLIHTLGIALRDAELGRTHSLLAVQNPGNRPIGSLARQFFNGEMLLAIDILCGCHGAIDWENIDDEGRYRSPPQRLTRSEALRFARRSSKHFEVTRPETISRWRAEVKIGRPQMFRVELRSVIDTAPGIKPKDRKRILTEEPTALATAYVNTQAMLSEDLSKLLTLDDRRRLASSIIQKADADLNRFLKA